MTGCVNDGDLELSLELTIGSGGRLSKCSEEEKNKNDAVFERQGARRKQEVRRGAVRVEEDAEYGRVRKRTKSEFRLEGVDEGGGSFSSGDAERFSGVRKCPRDIGQVVAGGVKEKQELNSNIDEKVVGLSSTISHPPAVVMNLNGQSMSSQTVVAAEEGAERSVTLPWVLPAKMPCVSTIGNGPSGTTVRGFLYRYTKEEVCIVCVCHGLLFSPAKFVEHAGGGNVDNPLRHITVTPFPSPGP